MEVDGTGKAVATTLNGGFEIVNGGTTSGTTVNVGGLEFVGYGGLVSATSVKSGGLEQIGSNGQARGTYVQIGGREEILAGGVASGTTVGSRGEQDVKAGGVASGTLVVHLGLEVVSAGGTAVDTSIQGGTLDLKAGAMAAGSINFAGAGGGLVIEGTSMPTAVISGFAPTDTIDLSAVKFDPKGSVQLMPGYVLQVVENGATYQLNLDPHQRFYYTSFQLAADPANGGTVITATSLAGTGSSAPVDPKAGAVPSIDLLAQHMASSFASSGPIVTEGAGGVAGNHSAAPAPALTQPQRTAHVLM